MECLAKGKKAIKMLSNKLIIKRLQRSGIDRIKYYTYPRIPKWKVTKTQLNITKESLLILYKPEASYPFTMACIQYVVTVIR